MYCRYAAHAFGAHYQGKQVSDLSDITCFSFHTVKNITTGEGGMVTTNNETFAETIKIYGLHGMSKSFISSSKLE